jgi:hypothetical protein
MQQHIASYVCGAAASLIYACHASGEYQRATSNDPSNVGCRMGRQSVLVG